MDNTQDFVVKEQFSILHMLYVKEGTIQERLFPLLSVISTAGENLFSILKEKLEKFSLSFVTITGGSFDGAANLWGL